MNLISNMIASYATFIRWFLHDALWRRKKLTFSILLSGVVGVGFQAAVFVIVIVYARRVSSGESFEVAGIVLDPRSSMELLVGGSLLVVGFLLLAALVIYYSRRTTIRMAREYEEYCAKRVYRLLGEGGDLFSTIENGRGGESSLFRLVRTDSRVAGRVLRKVLALVIPGVTLLVAVGVLVYLESGLSAIIAALGSVLLFYQYRISCRAAQHSIGFEKLAPMAGAEYRALIQHYKYQSHSEANAGQAEQLFAGGAVRKQLDAYEGRLRAVESSRLASGLFTAVVVGLIVLIMGGGIILEGAGWGRLLVYVVALRFAMVNLQNVFSAITSINRFYPQVRRYFAFVTGLSKQGTGQYSPRDVYTLEAEGRVNDGFLEGSLPRYEIRRGSRLALVTPIELNRYTIAGVCESLLGADRSAAFSALHTSRYAAISHSCPTTSLRDILGLSAESPWDDLRKWFPNDELFTQAREQLPKSLDKTITPKLWNGVMPELKFVLSLVSARVNGCSWIFMEAEGLYRLGLDDARFYLELFGDVVSIVVYGPDSNRVGSFDEHAVLVADEEKLLGFGSNEWWGSVHEAVLGLMGRRGKTTVGVGSEDELDE